MSKIEVTLKDFACQHTKKMAHHTVAGRVLRRRLRIREAMTVSLKENLLESAVQSFFAGSVTGSFLLP
ncbi:hypothetical protein TH5_02445 [Thalassospira xianhensis MCCC 1A02616]|uniref:Uncharacterized protein n=1 Tax=Thalassospira xianhensis MCCC 1A02616 TaxID=1177929 RepID=A0A367UL71_9PROT|nr:hypothetical protein TH5_02445 [Thalassospira xianhensis MCCC 1A02616]